MDQLKILQKHLEWAILFSSENMDFIPSPDGLEKWIVRIRGIDGINNTYKNAEILFEVKAGDKYPFKPPSFSCLTPNGRFANGGPICVSNGEFHSQNYQKSLSIGGFMHNIISMLFDNNAYEGSIRIIFLGQEQTEKLSSSSRKYNIANHRQYNLKMDIQYLLMLASGFWTENDNKLIEVAGDKKLKNEFVKKLIGWSLDTKNISVSKESIENIFKLFDFPLPEKINRILNEYKM